MAISPKDFLSDISHEKAEDALIDAAVEGNLEVVEYWIAAGIDPNARHGCAYVLAAANNHFDVVEFLYPLVTESVRAVGLEIATFNQNTVMMDFLYTHAHAQIALANLFGGIRDCKDMGLEKILQSRAKNDPTPSAPSKIQRKIYN